MAMKFGGIGRGSIATIVLQLSLPAALTIAAGSLPAAKSPKPAAKSPKPAAKNALAGGTTPAADNPSTGNSTPATGNTPAADNPPATSDSTAAAAVSKLKDALAAAKTAETQARADHDATVSIIRNLPSGSPTLAPSSVDALTAAKATLADKSRISDPQAIADLDARLKKDTGGTDTTDLPVVRTALKSADDATTGIDSQLTAADLQDLNQYRVEAAGTLSAIDETTRGIKSEIQSGNHPSVTQRIQAAVQYADGLVDLVSKTETSNPLIRTDVKAGAADVRTAMSSGLNSLLAAEKVRVALAQVWPDCAAAFGNALADFKDDITPKLDKLGTAITDKDAGLFGRLGPWLQAVAGEADSRSAEVGKSVTAIMHTLAQAQRDEAVVAVANEVRTAANQVKSDLERIQADMPSLLQFWKESGYKDQLAPIDQAFGQLHDSKDKLAGQVALLTGFLAGDMEHFVQDQVRLFYFTDVPRLMKALNDSTDLYNPTQVEAARQDTIRARNELIRNETDIALLSEEINQHWQRVDAFQEAIRRAQAQLDDAMTRFQIATLRNKILSTPSPASTTGSVGSTSGATTGGTGSTTGTTAGDTGSTTSATGTTADSTGTNSTSSGGGTSGTTGQTDTGQTDAASSPAAKQPQDEAAQASQEISDVSKQIEDYRKQLADLNPKLETAKQALIDVQVQRASARRFAALAAQAETEAFGEARDNPSFWFARADGLSNDPARRVFLYGYADSSTLFIRGLPHDVERVKEIIATFDRPAPQARVTLYGLQLNGPTPTVRIHRRDKDKVDTEGLDAALNDVDDVLRDLRSSIVLIHTTLVNSVNQEVKLRAEKAPYRGMLKDRLTDDEAQRLANYYYYVPAVREALGFDKHMITGRITDAEIRSTAYLTRFTLYDPAKATTLGEALFVLSLGSYDSRLRTIGRFIAQIYNRYTVLETNKGFRSETDGRPSEPTYGHINAIRRFLHAVYPILIGQDKRLYGPFREALDDDCSTLKSLEAFIADAAFISPDPEGPTGGYPAFFETVLGSIVDVTARPHDEISANEGEILNAMEAKARENTSAEVRHLIRAIDQLPDDNDRFTHGSTGPSSANPIGEVYRRQYLPLVGWLYSKFYKDGEDGAYASQDRKVADGTVKLEDDWESQGRAAIGLQPDGKSGAGASEEYERMADRKAYAIADYVRSQNALSQATARVAAADDMIKRMIIIAEDDLDYFFVSPALKELRRRVVSRNVSVGSLQRESVLATSREVARIDPRATADLTLQQGVDLLDAAQQLGHIAARYRQDQRTAKLVSTAPLLGAGVAALAGSDAGTALAYGGLLSLLGGLAASPQNPPGEIYSVTSGNTFRLTPIFDPSGQALRFKFDYAYQNLVQEPDGTTTPDLSHVDRHTVNDTVQLSNLEVREISRFESNSRLGIPEVRSGGLPLLNQIPYIRDIPIIGYYYRRKAEAAVRQESILFAQTSIYPTVGDIMDLLTDVPPRADLSQEPPAYFQSKPLPTLDTLTLSLTTATVSDSGKVWLRIGLTDQPRDGGATIDLSSTSRAAGLPLTARIPAEGRVAYVPIQIGRITSVTPVTITARYGGKELTALLTVQPPASPAPAAPKPTAVTQSKARTNSKAKTKAKH